MIKDILPPILIKNLSNLFYGWSGDYSSWDVAQQKCTGYDSEIIFDKVKNALLKVKNGEAVFERDSVLFDKIHYSFPLLAALNLAALHHDKKLHVLDFGGSLGSSYFQNKNLLHNLLHEFSWNVVEQEHFVTEGKLNFSDSYLNFFHSIDECLQAKNNINLLLLSSVIQYLEKPYEFIQEITEKNFDYIVIDRTPLLSAKKDRLTIQKVSKKIYEAQYPCWLLSEQKLLNYFLSKYDLLADEVTSENINISNAAYRFFLFKKRIS